MPISRYHHHKENKEREKKIKYHLLVSTKYKAHLLLG